MWQKVIYCYALKKGAHNLFNLTPISVHPQPPSRLPQPQLPSTRITRSVSPSRRSSRSVLLRRRSLCCCSLAPSALPVSVGVNPSAWPSSSIVGACLRQPFKVTGLHRRATPLSQRLIACLSFASPPQERG
ncbi:hypothetical protein PIB30_095764 [Stylosanthes scabra]|uniref:Uncharacterized protein n=1 Tax=Stylosanthes scabra TaxID=79078 RepID=A0ABU6VXR1_9FABA|nr:hypothetical protein [Stylosanthes scabra]